MKVRFKWFSSRARSSQKHSSRLLFTATNLDSGKNVVIFGVENSSSVHINNKKSGPTQGLNDNTTTRRTTEAKYYNYFSRSQGKLCLSLNVKGRKFFLFVNSTKIHQFKAKTSKIKL